MSKPSVLALALPLCAAVCPPAMASGVLTVEIVAPQNDPFETLPGDETEFLAVAYLDGDECGEGEVDFLWDFDDGETSAENPALHAWADTGTYTVTVTATRSAEQAQDSLVMEIEADTQATPGYTLELEPASPDGTICDCWVLKVTAPGPSEIAGCNVIETWHRDNGGPWMLNTHANATGVAWTMENGKRVFRGSWLTWPCPNFSCQVYCKLSWMKMGMPPQQGVARTNTIHAVPKNTVVKAWSDLDQGQLVFYDPECTLASINHPQIDWNAIHKQWSGHHFDWWTNLLDLSGGTIRTIRDASKPRHGGHDLGRLADAPGRERGAGHLQLPGGSPAQDRHAPQLRATGRMRPAERQAGKSGD